MECEICGKNHQKIIKKIIIINGKKISVARVQSPCLKNISMNAVNLINKLQRGMK